ncbi:hypothetical protein [Leptospira meyeri]|uniref:hypothetical protein n=1 Tax=Leptospira meyeri TaxID=29508 RepID=UPI000C2AB1FF|nr:hypothetical protein [Leptospira meyeri]PKA22002.1 hypothetical protein CH381_33135 [Leptospira sp. mixed culture ATI2-C-A1]TGM23839.1 hypothetical protein EHQ73_02015 [Leptospira meyeri]
MKYRFLLLTLLFILNADNCKKQETILENEDSFYLDMDAGCYLNAGTTNEQETKNCATKKEELLCYDILRLVKSFNIGHIFKNTKWTGSNFNESDFNYYFNDQGFVTVLKGGPSKARDEYVAVGEGRIFKQNNVWVYEHSCDKENCEKLKFPIEFFDCSVRFYSNSSEYRLFLTIGDRNYNEPGSQKFLSIVLEDPVKPQIRNGFELYLVPPPPK